MKYKRVLSFILALVIILSLPQLNFQTNAIAGPDTSVGLDFTSCTSEWTGTGSYAGVYWNGSNQLTLTNATIHGNDFIGDNFAVKVPAGTTITLVGRNTLIAGSCTGDGFSRGIYSSGDLTIKGNGSLLVSAGSASSSRDTSGIVVYGFLTIDENPTIITKSGALGAASVGIYALNDVTINGGNITAIDGLASASGQGNGIYSSGQINLNGGVLAACSHDKALNKAPNCTGVTALTGVYSDTYVVYGDAGTYKVNTAGLDFSSSPISTGNLNTDGYHWEQSTKTLTIQNLIVSTYELVSILLPADSILEAEGLNVIRSSNNIDFYSRTIYCKGDLSIQGSGSLTAIGGVAGYGGQSIFADNNINIASGTINAIGGTTSEQSMGISTGSYGTVTISGGNVTAIGGTTYAFSAGIFADNFVTISGGNVTAVGGTTTTTSTNGACNGIFSSYGPKISGGNVIAIGGKATGSSSSASCGLFAIYGTGAAFSGGNITLIGNNKANYGSYTLTNNIVSIASANVDGSSPAAYSYADIGDYKYLQITPPPLYTATVTVNKDDAVWTEGTPALQLSTSDSSLQGAVSGSCSNGIYTFLNVTPSQTFYVWDTTSNQYTGNSVSSTNINATVDYYSVSLTAGTGISAVSGDGAFLKGSTCDINATVSAGYTWSKWTQTTGGADVSTDKNYSITNIAAPQSYTANAIVCTEGLFEGKYGKDQIFDVWRTPDYPEAGQLFTLSNFDNIYDATASFGLVYYVDWGTNNDRYVQFDDSSTQRSSTYPTAYTVKLNLYEADGTFVKTISEYGTVWGLGDNGIFYEGHDYFGYYIINNQAYDYEDSISYIPTTGLVTDFNDLINYSASTSVFVSNAPPTATDVEISGTAAYGEQLTGEYSYNDVESDTEGTSTFKWYRSDDAAGTNKQEISGETNLTYTVTEDDIGKYISFEVTPVASSGATTGTAVESSLSEIPVPEFTITFDSNGGDDVDDITQDYDTSVTKPADPEKTGYTFGGWYSDEGLNTAVSWPYTMTDEDVTFYAKWTINEYTITFDSSGGSSVTEITKDFDTSVTKPADPEKTGYTFGGWYSDEGLSTAVSWPYTMTDEDVTFYAKWTINEYTISFDSDGGSSVAEITGDYNTQATISEVSAKTGYTFTGWNTKADGTGIDFAQGDELTLTSDITLYALWSEDRNVTGEEKDGKTSADISPDDASVIGKVIADLGDINITGPASIFDDIIGEDITSFLRLTQSGVDSDTQRGIEESLGDENAVVLCFELTLEKVFSNGDVEQVHSLGSMLLVTISLTPEQIAKISQLDAPRLYWYNPVTETLTDMNAEIDLTAGTASFYTDHFSAFFIADAVNPGAPGTGFSGAELALFSTLLSLFALLSLVIINKSRSKRNG